jgi:hypothetical protein
MSSKKETVFSNSSSLPNLLLTEIQHYAVPVIAIFTKFDDMIKQVMMEVQQWTKTVVLRSACWKLNFKRL